MKKNYITPGLILIPMQAVSPNATVSGDDGGGMQPINAKGAALDEDEYSTNTGWDAWEE